MGAKQIRTWGKQKTTWKGGGGGKGVNTTHAMTPSCALATRMHKMVSNYIPNEHVTKLHKVTVALVLN